MKKQLLREPYDLHEHVWIYEGMKGLRVIAQVRSGKTVQVIIPIAKIRGYLRRRDKKAVTTHKV